MLGDTDYFYPACKSLINDIENRKKIAVVSYLVIMETIHVLRQRVISKSMFTGESRGECNNKIPSMKTLTQKFVRIILKLSKDNKIILTKPDTKIYEHHLKVMQKLNEYSGYVRVKSICPYCEEGRVNKEHKNKCPLCNNTQESIKKYQYKGLGHTDIEHAYFALYDSIPFFYSSDTSFNDLKNDPEFDTIRFEILLNSSM